MKFGLRTLFSPKLPNTLKFVSFLLFSFTRNQNCVLCFALNTEDNLGNVNIRFDSRRRHESEMSSGH